jgi:hypothetical protein
MRFACVLFVASLLWGIQSAKAATTYSYFYVPAQTSYDNVAPGAMIDVPLYLQEVNSDGSANSLLSSEDGLSAAGVSVNFFSSSGGNPTVISAIAPNSGTPTTGFDNVLDQSQTSSSAKLLEQLNFSDSDGVAAVPQGAGVSNVFLGTLSIQASPTPGQTTVFTIGAYDPDNGNTVTFLSGYDLDNNADPFNPADASTLYSSAAPTNFSVTTAVPEPGSCLLVIFTALIAMEGGRRNLRRSRDRKEGTIVCEYQEGGHASLISPHLSSSPLW